LKNRVGFFFDTKNTKNFFTRTKGTKTMERIEVGILGATGTVGQRFIALLATHPWFKVTWLGASQRSEGKAYRDATPWRLPAALPDDVAKLVVETAAPGNAPKVMFSGLDSSVAGDIEKAFAGAGHLVISNSKNYRMDATVPLMIPEINADHLKLLDQQQAARGWKGRIVTNPNCSVIALTMALAPLRQFGLRSAMVTTLQAISGAGYPGVASWDILGNVIPFIDGEEDKFQPETQKILGRFVNGAIEAHPVGVSATATRVPVHDGHTVSTSVRLEQKVTPDAIINAFNCFRGRPQELKLPSAPSQPVVYLTERNRPQPTLDVERGGGMTVSVGRLRDCPVLDYKFVALGHNTIRGAAGAAILNAELMREEGLL